MREEGAMSTEQATFAAGCFWGVEATFRKMQGILSTSVGYTGGTSKDPTYNDVCTGGTGHAEAVHVEYDSDQVSFEELLSLFWEIHNPTTLNRQGPDLGTQYRSAVFFHTPEQEAAAKTSKEALDSSDRHHAPVVTEVTPAGEFYQAEEYHQQYFEKQGIAHSRVLGSPGESN